MPFQLRTQSLSAPSEVRFTDSAKRVWAEPEVSQRHTQAEDTETFLVNTGNSEASGDVTRHTKRRLTSTHAYFYVDLDVDSAISTASIQGMADAFDNVIYPTLTQEFGSEPSPGIDNEKRIFIVLSPAVDNFGKDKGLLGYFWSRDALQRTNSNQKEVIFLTDTIFSHPTYTQYGTLAHEFTHMIVFNQKTLLQNDVEDTWLNEGWAMLGMDLCKYGLLNGNEDVARDLALYLKTPHLYSLTDWAGNPRGFSYGLSYLFCRYLYDNYKALIKPAIASPLIGITNFDDQLRAFSTNFLSVFTDWTTANYVSGLNLTSEPRFNYSVNLRAQYGSITLPGITPLAQSAQLASASLRPWSATYYSFDTPKSWRFNLSAGTVPLIGSAIRIN